MLVVVEALHSLFVSQGLKEDPGGATPPSRIYRGHTAVANNLP